MPLYNNSGVNNSNLYGLNGYSNPYSSVQMSSSNNGIIWVQGLAGAKAYPVAAGGSVLLMDSENECFYIKSTDASGMPMPLRTFKYEELSGMDISETTKDVDMSKYVTFDELEKRLNKIRKPRKYYEDDLDE